MTWIRSSACSMGSCVEVRHVDGHVEVRDSTVPWIVLHITPADWALFLVGAKAGEFDPPGTPEAEQCPRCHRSALRDELLRIGVERALDYLNSGTGLVVENAVRQALNQMRAVLDYPRPDPS